MDYSPKLTDKLLRELRDKAADFGLVIGGRCRHCLRPITALRSLRTGEGPACRRKHKGDESL